jgi:hypothetical protein
MYGGSMIPRSCHGYSMEKSWVIKVLGVMALTDSLKANCTS